LMVEAKAYPLEQEYSCCPVPGGNEG
jgi:hypothetical protein